MDEYHTIICGGGPAGLACATMLAKSGCKVLLIERNERIGPKVCAGGITWSGIINRVPERLIERSFPEQHVFTRWQKTTIRAQSPLVATLDRQALGEWMLEEAITAGAEIRSSVSVKSFSKNTLVTNKGSINFNNLVGADGSSSTIRRLLGIPTTFTGYGINFFVPGNFSRMEWHLNDRLFNNGYAWIFPHKDSASIGAYVMRGNMRPTALRKNFHKWAQKRGINLGRSRLTAALINCDLRGWRFGNCFLAGDAAGMASPLTGEGIYPAIISGEEIARTIIDPSHKSVAMKNLLRRHALHRRITMMTASNSLVCRAMMESLVAGLRAGIIPFSSLEMAS